MNFNFKKSLSWVISFLMALPVYGKDHSVQSGETQLPIVTPESNSNIVRSPEDQVQAFVERWNAASTLNDLIASLNLNEKQKDLVKKLKGSLHLSNQKLPKVEFDSETMHLTFDKNKKNSIHVLSFLPFMVLIQNKLLVFDQTDENAAFDYLFKQFSAKPGETVLLDLMFPKAHAFAFAPIMWAFLGIAFLVTVIPLATSYFEKKEREEKRENKSIQSSAPEYRDFAQQVIAQGHRLRGLHCNNDRLSKLSFRNQKNEIWDLTFDDTDDDNNIRFLTITSGKSVCHFVVQDEIWMRAQGMPASCQAPYRLPYQYPDYLLVDPSRRCCEAKYKKCAEWVAQDVLHSKVLGSSAPDVEKKGHR